MKVFIAIAATAGLSAGTAYADCSYPTPPDHLPDGNTATLQEMVEAQKAVKDYDKAINAYVACIQLERNDAVTKVAPKPGEKPTAEQKKATEDLSASKFRSTMLPSTSCRASPTASTSRSRSTRRSPPPPSPRGDARC